jgi:hypothetical protein
MEDQQTPPETQPAPVKNKGGRPKGWRKPVPQQKIERTAGQTTYTPRVDVEVKEVATAMYSDTPAAEQPQLREVKKPRHNPSELVPDASRSQGQFSLRRLVIQNFYTKKTRSLSVPFYKDPKDYIDRSSEVILEEHEAVYWSESQRDAELRAFATMIDPLAGNKNPHAQRPPQEAIDRMINTTE